MSGQDWAFIIGAVFAGIVLIMNTVQGWRNGSKIDDNTELTKAGTKDAAMNAREAVVAAREIKEQINGALDNKIHSVVKSYINPITDDIRDIKQSLLDLNRKK